MKSVRIRSFSGPIYYLNLCILSERGKRRSRKTQNTGSIHEVTQFIIFEVFHEGPTWKSNFERLLTL